MLSLLNVLRKIQEPAKLRMSISPFVLRRLKTDKHVISDLPEKMVQTNTAICLKFKLFLYEKTLNEMMTKISGFTGINRRGNIFKPYHST